VLLGFITYRTLIRTTDQASISDLATVIGAVGGGAVTTLVHPMTNLFGWYAIGLLAGFIAYAVLYCILNHGTKEFAKVMGRSKEPVEQIRGPNAPRRD
jgi:bacteriorhodopsin